MPDIFSGADTHLRLCRPRRFLTLAVSSTGRARDVTRDSGRPQNLSRFSGGFDERFSPLAKNSSHPNSFSAKTKTTPKGGFSFGGEGGIRTLEPLLMVTRFPIVRARPTTRLLRIGRRPLYNDFGKKSSIFFSFYKFSQEVRFFRLSYPEASSAI